jgi:hypothetical protein
MSGAQALFAARNERADSGAAVHFHTAHGELARRNAVTITLFI